MTWTGISEIKSGPVAREAVETMLREADTSYAVRRIPEGAILFWEGEPHKLHYYVVSGMVELYASDQQGRRRTIDFYGPGSFFSYMFLSEGNTAMTTARACTNCELIALTKTEFFKMLHGSPAFAEITVQSLFELLQMQTNEVIRASFYSVTRRCALLLASMTRGARMQADAAEEPAGAGAQAGSEPGAASELRSEPLLLAHDNTSLADMLGASRNSVSAAISQLQRQGVIRKHRAGVEVLDPVALERIGRTGWA